MLFSKLCSFILFVTVFFSNEVQNDTIYSTYVTFDNKTQTFGVHEAEPTNESFVAVAHMINATANLTGWTYLEVSTMDHRWVNDSVQAYAGGLAEGHLTLQLIDLHWQNLLQGYCDEPYSQYCLRLRDFLSSNLAWVRQQVETNTNDPYWHQVAMFYTQMKGISDGYSSVLGPISMDLDPLGIYLLQVYFELADLEKVLHADDVDDAWTNDHCSAIVKLMPHNADLYTAHNTWVGYSTMLRVLKKYSLRYHTSLESDSDYPVGSVVTCSSYPGYLTSSDDFNMLSSKLAATMIKNAKEDCQQVVFLTDALSVLQALQGETLPHLNEAMQEVAKERRVALQWIPAHCGIPGNEEADRLAKLGANHVQPSNNISFSEKKTLIKAANRPRTEQDDYHLLSRLEQVTLLRLRTGTTD
ncbi:putative phospholipase B-like 2 [Gigantopelta aegis]|uniref:putative phospholipase B-like 2 n=1 Tax=Gigantopelta aegis TaxID=1735272 RepID=UPI001B88D105|nr:putative phospholipase B-like 2 [Gigantopelta aegis]